MLDDTAAIYVSFRHLADDKALLVLSWIIPAIVLQIILGKCLFMIKSSNAVFITILMSIPLPIATLVLISAGGTFNASDSYSGNVVHTFVLLYLLLVFLNKFNPVRYALYFNIGFLVTFNIYNYFMRPSSPLFFATKAEHPLGKGHSSRRVQVY